MSVLGTAIVLIGVSAGLVSLIRTNLNQRQHARKLRAIYIAEANDLVGKPDFPDAHARLLVDMATLPPGWVTRYFVFRLVKDLFRAPKKARRRDAANLGQIPVHLQKKFVLATLAFALSDSYRCALLGRIFRASNNWIVDAVREPKPDVNAHATQIVIERVAQVRVPHRGRERELMTLST